MLEIKAKITGLNYNPKFSFKLPLFNLDQLEDSLKKTCFRLQINNTSVLTVSRWVSPKRTRSYPYVNVFKTLGYNDGKRITIIPVIKDEGIKGDRDFIQWDTISMMSLLGVYVILAYYNKAKPSVKNGKITNQEFDYFYIHDQLKKVNNFKLDALHWNMNQASKIDYIMELAKKSYLKISFQTNIELQNVKIIDDRIKNFKLDLDNFKEISRSSAILAQKRESVTIQPKENTDISSKGIITITNFLKGKYYLTVDEALIKDGKVLLIEAKHTKSDKLPSLNDIIDGVLKLILYCNIEELTINNKVYSFTPILKLTANKPLQSIPLKKKEKDLLEVLKNESEANGFELELV